MGAVHNHSRHTPTAKQEIWEYLEEHHRGGIKTSLERVMAEFTRLQSRKEKPAKYGYNWSHNATELVDPHEKHQKLTRKRDVNLEVLLHDRSYKNRSYKNVDQKQVGPLHIHNRVLLSKQVFHDADNRYFDYQVNTKTPKHERQEIWNTRNLAKEEYAKHIYQQIEYEQELQKVDSNPNRELQKVDSNPNRELQKVDSNPNRELQKVDSNPIRQKRWWNHAMTAVPNKWVLLSVVAVCAAAFAVYKYRQRYHKSTENAHKLKALEAVLEAREKELRKEVHHAHDTHALDFVKDFERSLDKDTSTTSHIRIQSRPLRK
jgi:hypothetical protein